MFHLSTFGLPNLAGRFHVNHYYDLKFNPVNHCLKSLSLNSLPLNLQLCKAFLNVPCPLLMDSCSWAQAMVRQLSTIRSPEED